MTVYDVDTEGLIEMIGGRIDRGEKVDRMTLGTLLGLSLDQCYDSNVWEALRRLLIWYMDSQIKEADSNHTEANIEKHQPIEETEDHFTYDDITYPIHYAGNNKITCKDALNSMMCPLEAVITPKIGYWLGCAFKYLWRAFLKGDPKKDLLKCQQCINERLNLM